MTNADRSKSFPFIVLLAPRNRNDEIIAALWSIEILGLESVREDEVSEVIKVYFASESLAASGKSNLITEFPDLEIMDSGEVEYADWESFLHGGFDPQVVGNLFVLPAENPPPIPAELIPLYIIPGRGFGTGSHPTTRLIMQMVVENDPAGKVILDVGTGSGILAVAACHLGAEKVIGVEIDDESLINAAENAENNKCAGKIEYRHGSIDVVNEGPFEIVYANIIAPVIAKLLPEGLADLVSEGGVLLASGIMAEEKKKMLANFAAAGFTVEDVRGEGNWLAMLCRKI